MSHLRRQALIATPRPSSLPILMAILVVAMASCHSSEGENVQAQSESQPVSEGSENEGPVATINTVTLEEGYITEEIVAYGIVVPSPDALVTISVLYESRISRIHVSERQSVDSSTLLVDLAPSPEAQLAADQARLDTNLMEERMNAIESRVQSQLATSEELLQARQEYEDMRLQHRSLQQLGMDGATQINGSGSGIVLHIYASNGSIVPPGSPIMDIALDDQVEVRLGIEPEDIQRLVDGQTVILRRPGVPTSTPLTGTVTSISSAVNPDTHLVDVVVSLADGSDLLLGESLVGLMPLRVGPTLVVPRDAVLPEEDHWVLYTVEEGHAVRHEVRIGMENDVQIEVVGDDLAAGDELVVVGNYELEEGMAVRVENTP